MLAATLAKSIGEAEWPNSFRLMAINILGLPPMSIGRLTAIRRAYEQRARPGTSSPANVDINGYSILNPSQHLINPKRSEMLDESPALSVIAEHVKETVQALGRLASGGLDAIGRHLLVASLNGNWPGAHANRFANETSGIQRAEGLEGPSRLAVINSRNMVFAQDTLVSTVHAAHRLMGAPVQTLKFWREHINWRGQLAEDLLAQGHAKEGLRVFFDAISDAFLPAAMLGGIGYKSAKTAHAMASRPSMSGVELFNTRQRNFTNSLGWSHHPHDGFDASTTCGSGPWPALAAIR